MSDAMSIKSVIYPPKKVPKNHIKVLVFLLLIKCEFLFVSELMMGGEMYCNHQVPAVLCCLCFSTVSVLVDERNYQ